MPDFLREQLSAYIPMDRRHALATGKELDGHVAGAAIFADISGFTALTDALVLELGPRRGAEELTRYLNQVYDAVIDELHRYGGSAVAFAGDGVTCWIHGDNGEAAIACGLAMQRVMAQFSAIRTPGGAAIALTIRVAVTVGHARRFQVGSPDIRYIDALAGEPLVRLAEAANLAEKGEVVLDKQSAEMLIDRLEIASTRTDPSSGFSLAIVAGLRQETPPKPWPDLDANALDFSELRRWLLAPVYARLERGMGEFLAELRPTVALMLRYSGIDYDGDAHAGQKLDAYIRWVQEIAARYEGTLIDLNIGDKGSYIYVNFGAPLAHEDNIERAASMALQLRQSSAFFPFIDSVQIGISQGRMRAGAYGGEAHRTYGVLGAEVSIAARLMMAASPQQVLFSKEARDATGDHFVFQELPQIQFKGRSEPARIYALLDRRRTYQFRIPTAAYATPMVGRDVEKLRLAEQLSRLADNGGQIAVISGEAGIGKSRLMAELVHEAHERRITVLGGECQSYGVNTGYLAWQTIFLGLFGIDPAWDSAQQTEILAERLQGINPDLVSRLPLLGAVLNLDLPDNELTASFDAKLRKASLESLLVDCLRSLIRAPMLLVIEDCHWLDPLSADLVNVVSRVIADLPVMLLLTARTLDGGHLNAEGLRTQAHSQEVPLSPLDTTATTALVRNRLAQDFGIQGELSEKLVARMIAQADGIPFFVDELVNYMHSAGIDPTDAATAAALDLPDSVHRLVHSRLDQLDEHPRSILKLASVLGRVFNVAWLAEIAPTLGSDEQIAASLDALVKAAIVERDPNDAGATCFFRQAIVQGATYESLPYATRCSIHENVGRYLEQQFSDRRERYLDLIVHHYDHSENTEKRRRYLRQAGEAAQAAYANETAIDYYRRLLALLPEPEQIEILLKLGEVLQLVGRWDDAASAFRQALAYAEAAGSSEQVGWCHVAQGELLRKQGRYAEASDNLAQARVVFTEREDSAGLGQVLHFAGTLAAQQGQYEEANGYYQESLTIRRQLGDRRNEASLLSNLGIVARFQGAYDQARKLHEEALEIRRQLDERWAIAVSLVNLGNVVLDQGEGTTARQFLEEGVTLLRQVGDQSYIADTLTNLGNVARDLQDLEEAEHLYAESLEINLRLDAQWSLAYLFEDMSGLFVLRQDYDLSLILLGAATKLRERLGAPRSKSEQKKLDTLLEPIYRTMSMEEITKKIEFGGSMKAQAFVSLIQQSKFESSNP